MSHFISEPEFVSSDYFIRFHLKIQRTYSIGILFMNKKFHEAIDSSISDQSSIPPQHTEDSSVPAARTSARAKQLQVSPIFHRMNLMSWILYSHGSMSEVYFARLEQPHTSKLDEMWGSDFRLMLNKFICLRWYKNGEWWPIRQKLYEPLYPSKYIDSIMYMLCVRCLSWSAATQMP